MKRALIGFFAIAAVLSLPPLSRLIGRKMSEHCAQMASRCREMMGDLGGSDKAADTDERFAPEAPQFLGDREPVGTT